MSTTMHPLLDRRSQRPWRRLVAGYAWRADGLVAAAVLAVTLPLSVFILSDPGRWKQLVRDVYQVANSGDDLPFYTGYVTYANAVCWFGAAAIGLVVAGAALRARRWRAAGLLGGTAVLSATLGFDDLFMFHDELVFALHLPLPEEVLVLGYALAVAAGGLYFLRDLLHDRDLPLLVLAALFFAVSALVDLAYAPEVLEEDTAKFAGSLCWLAWHWRVAVRSLSFVPSGEDQAHGARG